MKIAIVGSGLMGATIGAVCAELGHQVIFSYSRSTEKLQRLATAHGALWGSCRQAVEVADLIVLAVHWTRIEDVIAKMGNVAGKTIMSCTNPLDASDSHLVIAHTDSGAETLARKFPNTNIVAAFQATPSEVIKDVFNSRENVPRPSMVFCGNDNASKYLVQELLKQFGFDPVDAGPLKLARYIEPFAMLATALAYGTDQGPEWVYRFERYGS